MKVSRTPDAYTRLAMSIAPGERDKSMISELMISFRNLWPFGRQKGLTLANGWRSYENNE